MPSKAVDEFGWILIGALVFILIITLAFLPPKSSTIIVTPNSKDLNMAPGSATSFFIEINSSSGKKLSEVVLTPSGEIRDWLSFDKNNFDVVNSTTVRVNVVVPRVALRIYTGTVAISSSGGNASVSIRVNVANITELKTRAIYLGEISVKYSIGSESLTGKQDLEVVRGYFTNLQEDMTISIPAEKLDITTDAYLNLTIEDTNNEGNLVVTFNNIDLLNKKVDEGTLIIPVSRSLINDTNSINIRTTRPPIYKFWAKSFYNGKVDFVVNYQDIKDRERNFNLKDEEISNFRYFNLVAFVKDYSTPLKSLMIRINNQPVYSKVPPLAGMNETFGKDLFGNMLYLQDENNTIAFSFESESLYRIEDAFLIVYYV